MDTSNLFVACRVYDMETEVEPFVQYDSFARITHEIFVNPKKILVYSKNSRTKFYDFKTGEELRLRNYESSFETESLIEQTLYLSKDPSELMTYRREKYFKDKEKEIAFLIPFDMYIESRLGFVPKNISRFSAKSLVTMLNASESKSFVLSFDKEEAIEQIKRKIYKIKTSRREAREEQSRSVLR